MTERYKLTYFAVWAKGPASALALEFSGLDWVGDDAATGPNLKTVESGWDGENKKYAAWNMLPNLTVPGMKEAIGQESAILNFIGRKVPAMGGETDKDFAASQQLLGVGEDIYQKLVALMNTTFGPNVKEKERDLFWNMDDATLSNEEYGIKVYLSQLENFYKKCERKPEDGKFTETGTSVGECKLFSSLHACVMIKGQTLLCTYPGVLAFYTRFLNQKQTQSILADGGNFPYEFSQYFI